MKLICEKGEGGRAALPVCDSPHCVIPNLGVLQPRESLP
jgi:hypothetical protein